MTFIFDPDHPPTPACHAATVVALPDRLVAAWFAGSHEKNPDVGIWSAVFRGGAWSTPREVANGGGEACWNPVLFNTPEGLRLFYKVGASPSKWRGEVLASTDSGENWRRGPVLPDGFLGPIKNKPLLLDNGDLLCPSSREQGGWSCHFEILSPDGARHSAHGVPDPLDLQAIQPTVFRRERGFEALVRTKRGIVARTTSADGRTWSPLQATPLPNPNSGIDAANLPDGRAVLAYNPTRTPDGRWGGPRTPLTLAVSGDDGEWHDVLTLDDDATAPDGSHGEFSYPAVICAADAPGSREAVHVVYTWHRRSIKHVALAPPPARNAGPATRAPGDAPRA